jgi:hypothetical protein
LKYSGERIWGLICYEQGIIEIDVEAKEETLLDTHIHEFTHSFFDAGNQRLLHEETVERFATDLMRYLWRLGYRCPSDEEFGEE